MKLLRFAVDGATHTGRLDGAAVVGFAGSPDLATLLDGSMPAEAGRWPLAAVTVLAPLPQARLFCIGLNYPKPHPLGGEVKGPANISYFIKHQAALVPHGAALRPPGVSVQFDYECELAAVIGRGGHRIAEADALGHVGGYTILNDGSVRDWQAHSVTAGKNFWQSGSCGPYVTTAEEVADWRELRLQTRLNGRTVQDSKAGAMFFGVEAIIAYLSTITPLLPGDVIATGSPEGTGATQKPPRFLTSGDALSFEVSGLGILANTVA
ncbi:fumarylacetoacetate hydrolase family protein [Falsiroseomonas selenitidurans]|uniref:Fumarylacetoacetate hydrolase family protein n=1 Tax=Falsiroseomonas selenitidurans TaxID=2716335 RepID=A0ABX1EDE4_9PROT|nr:fumarylacetoacetate hydrolase family protein [Falsiroseomonas selenitidurans]NKC32920.1 fumarylacetoacetate hydrolase family protein [Falsiroseomonas selenitidurans]